MPAPESRTTQFLRKIDKAEAAAASSFFIPPPYGWRHPVTGRRADLPDPDLVNFGQYVGFDATLSGALKQLLTAAGGQPTTTGPNPPPQTQPNQPNGGPLQAAVDKMNKALTDLKAAQQAGDFTKYGQALQALQDAITEYQKAQQAAASPAPSPSGSASPSPAPSVPG